MVKGSILSSQTFKEEDKFYANICNLYTKFLSNNIRFALLFLRKSFYYFVQLNNGSLTLFYLLTAMVHGEYNISTLRIKKASSAEFKRN